MRSLLTSFLCILFVMSGTLVTAAHTGAHIQSQSSDIFAVEHHHVHHDGAELHESSTDESFSDEDHSDGSNEHGNELHVTAIDIEPLSILPTACPLSFDAAYKDKKFPTIKTPSDPFPDRA